MVQGVHATIEEVSSKEELGDKAIAGVVDRWINTGVQWAEGKGVKVLGLDEIALKTGQRDFGVRVTARGATGEVGVLGV